MDYTIPEIIVHLSSLTHHFAKMSKIWWDSATEYQSTRNRLIESWPVEVTSRSSCVLSLHLFEKATRDKDTQDHVTQGLGVLTAVVFLVGEMAGSGVLALPNALENAGQSVHGHRTQGLNSRRACSATYRPANALPALSIRGYNRFYRFYLLCLHGDHTHCYTVGRGYPLDWLVIVGYNLDMNCNQHLMLTKCNLFIMN